MRAWQVVRRAPWVLVGALITVALGWGLWFTIAWGRYGQTRPRAADPVLDRFMPTFEVAERHEIGVRAPAAVTYAAARDVDLECSAIVRAVFRGRSEMLEGTAAERHLTLGELQAMGWGLLAEVPGRELVFGAVTQPWRGDVRFESLAPDSFAAFHRPGYVKIIWTLAVDSAESRTSRFRTETRVMTTDEAARTRFRRYWALFSPGILLIRWQAIRLVRADAERRFQP